MYVEGNWSGERSTCKGVEVGVCLMLSWKSREASVVSSVSRRRGALRGARGAARGGGRGI